MPAWLPVSGTLFATVGLAVSSYLTVAHYAAAVALSCPDTGVVNCVKVTTSAESVIGGVPVAVLGLAFFVVMLIANLPVAWRQHSWLVRATRLAVAGVGVGMVAWLIYVELFRLAAICLYCTSVHVLAVLLFAVAALGTAVTSESDQDLG